MADSESHPGRLRGRVRPLLRLLHWFIPARATRTHDQVMRSRILVSMSLVFALLLGAALLLSVPLGLGDTPLLGSPLLTLLSAVVLALAAFRATGVLSLAANLLAFGLYANLVAIAYFYGGLSSPTAPTLMLLPVIASLLGGRRHGLAWGGVAVGTWLLLFLNQATLPAMPDAEQLAGVQLIALICSGLAILALTLISEGTNLSLRTELARERAIFEYMAGHDPLTRLPNRRSFFHELDLGIRRSSRSKQRLALLMIDLDGFKPINDELGHPSGDALLRVVSQRLRGGLRATDRVARIGGDEFGVILESVHSADDVRTVIGKVQTLLAEPTTIRGRAVTVGASVGVALCPDDGSDAEDLVELADRAMYRAKSNGSDACFAGEAEETPS